MNNLRTHHILGIVFLVIPFFALVSSSVLCGAAPKSNIKIKKLVIKKQLPDYEAFKVVGHALDCIDQEMDNAGLAKYKAWGVISPFIDHSHHQTEQGIFFEAGYEGVWPEKLWTPFGEVALVRGCGALHQNNVMAVTKVLLEKRFTTTLHSKAEAGWDSDVYRIDAIDGKPLPTPSLRKFFIKENIIEKSWEQFGEQVWQERKAKEDQRQAQNKIEEARKLAEAVEQKKDDDWELV